MSVGRADRGSPAGGPGQREGGFRGDGRGRLNKSSEKHGACEARNLGAAGPRGEPAGDEAVRPVRARRRSRAGMWGRAAGGAKRRGAMPFVVGGRESEKGAEALRERRAAGRASSSCSAPAGDPRSFAGPTQRAQSSQDGMQFRHGLQSSLEPYNVRRQWRAERSDASPLHAGVRCGG